MQLALLTKIIQPITLKFNKPWPSVAFVTTDESQHINNWKPIQK